METFLQNFTHFLHEDGPRMQRSLFSVLVSPEEYNKLDFSGTDSWLQQPSCHTSFHDGVVCDRHCVSRGVWASQSSMFRELQVRRRLRFRSPWSWARVLFSECVPVYEYDVYFVPVSSLKVAELHLLSLDGHPAVVRPPCKRRDSTGQNRCLYFFYNADADKTVVMVNLGRKIRNLLVRFISCTRAM